MTTDRVLRAITDLQPGDHLGFLYQTEAELRALLTPFLRQGLERGEQVLYITDVHPAETILDYLRDDGLEVEPYLTSGQLRILTSANTYLRTGAFNPEDMIAFWRTETERALAEGYQGLRAAGEMSWALQGLPGSERLLEYESKLSAFLPGSECLIICLYDWRRLNPEMLFGMLATHPTAVAGTEIYDNFYYLPPLDLVQESLPMSILRYWLETLAERKQVEAALKASEARYRAIVEDQTEFICRFLPDGILTFVNEAYCRYFGWKREELIGHSLMQFIPAENRAELAEHLASLKRENPVTTREEWNVLRGGEIRWLKWTERAIFDEQGRLVEFQAVGRDLTERKRAEEEVRRHTARMEALAEICQALPEVGLDVQAVLETIIRHTAEVIGDASRITLLSSDEQWFKPVAFHHPNPEVKALMASLYPNTPISASQEWMARILRTGQPLLIPVVTPEQLRQSVQPEYVPFFEQVGLHSLLLVPLRVQGRVIGTLGLTRDQPGHPYTPDDQVLLQDLADRAALTIQNARLFEQVQEAHKRLQVLSRRLLEVQEAERRHIARELHDEIGQTLTGLKFLLEIKTPLPAEAIQATLDKALRLADELTTRLQELSLNLRPPMLDELGLLPTLAWHFKRYTDQTHIHVDFKYMGPERRLGPEIEMAVYRIVQEALTNVARHAQVIEVTVQVWMDQNSLRLQIEDAGVGFDLEEALAARTSSGLSGMYERAALLGGQLTIVSAPGAGASLIVEFPLSDPVGERSEQP